MLLTLEQQACNFETSKHIRLVQKNIHEFVKDLIDRADCHDDSKLESPEVEVFTEFTPKLAASTYGSTEYDDFRKSMGMALKHHYDNNTHHPEFYIKDEIWKQIHGQSNYEVSTHGNIRNSKNELLHQYITPKGYCRIQLSKDGKQSNLMVHRLVALTFISNPDNKPEVNHKDGDKRNNKVSNLEWVTSSENLIHAYENGLKEAKIKYVVECESLGLVTFGCEKMAQILREKGYPKANASRIWACINNGGKHLDLEFIGSNYESWMNSPINNMTLMDLIEMFCDWKAAAKRHNDGNLNKSIEINGTRFSMSPQLIKIFENTAKKME